MTFPSVHPALGRALSARGYTPATAVQAAVLAAEGVGRDLLVSAQTGSGKTVAFGLGIAPVLLGAEERLPPPAAPLALVIAPTRELAMQVQRELDWLYKDAGARVVTCVGGMDARAEARQLGFGAHIVVGTPGRLRDHLERRRLDLTSLKSVVLDEADEMLDLGFREDLEFILDATPETRQTLLFSATMPREIETLARRYQRDAVRIETLRRNEQDADIEYRAIRVAPHDIEHAVVNVLRFHEMRAALVFCATRESVKRMHARLVERGFSAVALSGELTQNERSHALQALRDGRARVLVATDVAARGLDLPDLALVIHADLPNSGETLLHRSGRTGRAGNKGLCTLIVPFNRRRKAEALLGAAKLKVTWAPAPSADDIRARDQERFLADAIFTEAATEDDEKLVRALQAARSPDEIAFALVRLHRARLPAPEDLTEDTGPPPRREFQARGRREWSERRDERASSAPERGRDSAAPRLPREPRPPRDQGREMVWFEVDIGRARKADPRWLLPLICRAGNVTKSEIGAIRIHEHGSRFEIAADVADRFDEAARTMKPNEARIARAGEGPPEAPADGAHGPEGAPRRRFGKPSWQDRKGGNGAPRRNDKDSAPRRSENSDAPRRNEKDGAPRRTERDAAPRGNDAAPHRKYEGAGRRFAKPRSHEGGPKPFSHKGKPVSKYAHKKKTRETSATDA